MLPVKTIFIILHYLIKMSLQNRVDPQGNIITTSARGNWMGNRGQLHDKGKQILRPFKLKAWLICLLEFRGRQRQVMSPNFYTELFFMDEATAFAAGHRPCFECRRADYERFKTCWINGNPGYGFTAKIAVQKIDEILHTERFGTKGSKVTFEAELNDLPDGTFIQVNNEPYLITHAKIHRWTPFGYDKGTTFSLPGKVTVLTPASTVNAFKAGYRPQMGV
jgi:hypothetical protein